MPNRADDSHSRITSRQTALGSAMWMYWRLWFGMLVLFAVGRLFYLVDYRQVLLTESFSLFEIPAVFLSAARFDASASSFLLAFVFLLSLLPWGGPKSFSQRSAFTIATSAAILAVVLILADHYYYLYFKDHFNAFFWEFQEDASNAWLVVSGLSDVIPIGESLVFFVITSVAMIVWIRHVQQTPSMPTLLGRLFSIRFGTAFAVLAHVVLFAVATRATFDHRPLLLQDRRIMFSSNSFINLLHTNPVFPLVRSYKEAQAVKGASRYGQKLDFEDVNEDFEATTQLISGARHAKDPRGFHFIAQTIEPTWPLFFERRPKHIVLIFMESYSRWLLDYEDGDLNRAVGGRYLALRNDGLEFTRHFSSAAGTIKNIASAIYSFPLHRDFQPSWPYHKEGLKPFPGRMPAVFKQYGLDPVFFYGGVVAWHRLYHFIPRSGFSRLLAENSFPDLPRHEHGLYDRDLFGSVDQYLQTAEDPSLIFVMSLTNHPPYIVPADETLEKVVMPKSLSERLIDSPAHFQKRLQAFRHADAALGEFMKKAADSDYFKDTLFVITGDHTFTSGVGFAKEHDWKSEQLPFLFYAPHLLKAEHRGRKIDAFTTHLDIVPTLTSLVTKAPVEIQTWGKNMLAATDAPKDTGINNYFSCWEGLCLRDGQIYRLTDDERFELADPTTTKSVVKKLMNMEKHYYRSGMHYFFNFRDTDISDQISQ